MTFHPLSPPPWTTVLLLHPLSCFFFSSNPSYIGSQSSLDSPSLESFVAIVPRIYNGLVGYYIMSKFLCIFLRILQNWVPSYLFSFLITLHHEQLALYPTPPSFFSPDHFPLVILCSKFYLSSLVCVVNLSFISSSLLFTFPNLFHSLRSMWRPISFIKLSPTLPANIGLSFLHSFTTYSLTAQMLQFFTRMVFVLLSLYFDMIILVHSRRL